MKTYIVVFMNVESRKVGVDEFTCNSASAARHDFFECYRHAIYTILDVIEKPDKE